MDVALASLLNFYVFSTGRRIFALQQAHKVAKEMQLTDLEQHIASAIKADRKTHELEQKWAASQKAPTSGSADAGRTKRVDAQVDRALTALRDGAAAQIDGAEPSEKALVASIEAMLTDLFPKGVYSITTLPYVDELNAVDAIVKKLSDQYADLVTDIGLERHKKRLAKLAVEYREAQETTKPAGPSFDEVRAARAEGQERMLEASAMILGKYPSSKKDHVAARQSLLGPFLRQNEAIRQYLKSRRAVEDVNPDTGEVDPNAPAGEPEAPAPAGATPSPK
jgi:hypothetical protein